MEKQKIEMEHSVTGNKLGRSYGFPDFFNRHYLGIIENPCYNTTGKQIKQLPWKIIIKMQRMVCIFGKVLKK